MKPLRDYHPADWLFSGTLVILTIVTFRFVWHDVAGGFEDDSASYLILAQWLSPWFSAPELLVKAASLEKYPPLFPLVLALTGASQNILLAHFVVTLFHLAAIVLTYLWGKKVLQDPWSALVGAWLFAVLPSVWINLLGILSESLYLVISLALLLFHSRMEPGDRQTRPADTAVVTSLLTLLMLTRSIGFAAVLAYGLWCVFRFRPVSRVFTPAGFVPVLAPVLAALTWSFLRHTSGEDLYASDVLRSLLELNIWPQMDAVLRFWIKAFLIYWSDANLVQGIAVLAFGILALIGMASRLGNNKLDGWYALVYLGVVIAWPYPGQVGRFIHGLLPILVIQAMVGTGFVLRRLRVELRQKLITFLALIVLIMVLPSLAFIAGRAGYQTAITGMDFSRISQFYGVINPRIAEFRALRNEQLRLDFAQIARTTPEDALIMWYTPQYLRLYANRDGVEIPDFESEAGIARAVRDSGARYVFLSDLHPRYSNESFSGLFALPYFKPFTREVWSNPFPNSSRMASVLLEIDNSRLDAMLAD